jgi:RimJ/RimL family protein N-acetyltransferase
MTTGSAPRALLPPTLEAGDLRLRPFRPDDEDAVNAHGRDPEMTRWTVVPTDYTRAAARSFLTATAEGWRTGAEYGLAVEIGGRWAGGIDLRPQGAGMAELGYSLAAWARGRGVMSRAVRMMMSWGFGPLGLHFVHWRAQVGNWPSRRVAWAVGFRIVGAVPGLLQHRGQRVDAWLGTLRRGDPMIPIHAWLEPVRISGDLVVLRPHRDGDVPRMVEACRDAETQHRLPGLPEDYSDHHAREHLQQIATEHACGTALFWAVADPRSDLLLGEIGLFVRDGAGRHGEVGYWTHPQARGRGLTASAVRLATRHALLPLQEGGLGMDRLLLRTAPDNPASRAVAEQVGFRPAGVDRDSGRRRDGTCHDHLRYDLLAGELAAVR